MSEIPEHLDLADVAICANCGGIFHKNMVVDTRKVKFSSRVIYLKHGRVEQISAVQWEKPICWGCADSALPILVGRDWFALWVDDPRHGNYAHVLNQPKLPEDVR